MMTKLNEKKYCLFDIYDDLWAFEDMNGRRISGNNFQEFIDTLNELSKNIYIICNNNFDKILENFQKFNLELGKDYKISLKNKNVIKGITFSNTKNKNLYFRNYGAFFSKKLFEDIFSNLDTMDKIIQEFATLTKNKTFFKYYDLSQMIYDDFSKSVDWKQNYASKINETDYKKLIHWKTPVYTVLAEDCKNKVINVSFAVDKNSYYWSIMSSKLMPYGSPIKCNFEDENNICNHKLQLLKLRISCKLLPNGIAIINRKTLINDIHKPSKYLKELTNAVVYWTGDMLDLVQEHYDITNLEILDNYCFEGKENTAQVFIEKWFKIKQLTTDSNLVDNIKLSLNKLIGIQGSEKIHMISISQPFEINGKKISSKTVQINYNNRPYIPLYIFVIDSAKNEMIRTIQTHKENFVASRTDSLTFKNLDVKDFKYEIDSHKLGAFKFESRDHFYYYKNATNYISTNDINKKGGIKTYRHSGIKGLDISNLSFMDVVEMWEAEKMKIGEKKNVKTKINTILK